MRGEVLIVSKTHVKLRLDKEELSALYTALTEHVGANNEREAQVMDAMTDKFSDLLEEWDMHERRS
jgi:hypothetical protein